MTRLLLALVLVLGGCAAQQNVPLNVSGLETSEKTTIHDLRPPIEKEGETFSYLVTSDAYAIARVQEKATTPSPFRLFQHRAYERFDGRPPEIKVLHLVVYRNSQSELRRAAIGAGLGGIIGAVVGGQTVSHMSGAVSSLVERDAFDTAAGNEFKRGIYADAENPGRGSVLIVYAETDVGGKRVFTRTLSPLRADPGESPFLNALEAAFAFHLDQYVPGATQGPSRSAVAPAATTTVATTSGSWPPGTRLVYVDADVQTRVPQGDVVFVVTDLGPRRWVLNEGAIVSASDGTPEKGAMHGLLVYGVGPTQIARGGQWSGTFRVGGLFEDVPVTFTMIGRQAKVVSGRRFDAARIGVQGFASRVYGGGVGTAGGAPFNGEMLVDSETGLVLELTVSSRHPSYAIRRELVRIASN